jgi:hypothetical protein
MPRNSNRGRNNNPSGRNQFSSDWGVTELVRERPIAAAAAAAGAAAAGLFLWSRRAQISNQLSNLSDQIGEWTSNSGQFETGDDTAGLTTGSRTRGMSETGGGNASLGRRSGGGGVRSTASGRGRAQASAATQQ